VIVAKEFHRQRFPLGGTQAPIQKLGDDRVVAVGEDVGFDEQLVTDGALYRIAPAVDLRADRLDDDARRRSFLFDLAIQA
jgi:hypothetical protein